MNATPARGTALAPGAGVPAAPPRYQAVRAAHVRAAANEWIRARPYRMAPTHLVVSTLLYLAGFPLSRVIAIVAIQIVNFTYMVVEAMRSRRAPSDVRAIFISHMVLLTSQAMIVTLAGGLAGPLWPGVLGATMGTVFVFGRSRESEIAIGYAALIVVVIALVPAEITGPPIARSFHIALCTWSISFSLFMLRFSTYVISDAHARTESTLDKMRENVITAAEARRQSLEVIGSKVAHELKNPLSAIKGLVQLLARGAADHRTRERLEVITSEVGRMEVILRDYLSFSRPLEDLSKHAFDLGALADDIIAVLEARAETAGVALSRAGESATAFGDPRRLKEALFNLIANAIEATPRDGSVVVETIGDDAGTSITVRDTGRGIAPDDLARVGTPFFTTREGGTGLGFVLARTVVRQHGGDVVIESEPGRGTTVRINLPTQACAALATEGAKAHG
ncbi:Sensor histidine kinase [Minicystis rosea]|nr:Sensor histidine kinase [Minicystis rosea]